MAAAGYWRMARVQFVRTQTVRLHTDDDVVIATRELAPGTLLTDENVTTGPAIPAGHKVATLPDCSR